MRGKGRLTLDQLAPYLLTIPDHRLDWPAVFGNDHPVEIEVGFGKGMFLVAAAMAFPERNFLGLEVARKHQLYTAGRLARRDLRHVRVAHADAQFVFRERIPENSVATVHVYFPDPWWKRRHLKRRLFDSSFAAQIERVLQPGGWLRLATDVDEYFGVIIRAVAQHTRLERQAEEESLYPTNFERKYRMQGRPIYRAWYRKS